MRRFSTRVPYDPVLDPATWGGWSPAAAAKNTPQFKRDIRNAKGVRTRAKLDAPRKAAVADAAAHREQAEARAAEAIRKAVAILEFAISGLNETPAPTQYRMQVRQHRLVNAVFDLKSKCGVKFTQAEFDPYAPRRPGARSNRVEGAGDGEAVD